MTRNVTVKIMTLNQRAQKNRTASNKVIKLVF